MSLKFQKKVSIKSKNIHFNIMDWKEKIVSQYCEYPANVVQTFLFGIQRSASKQAGRHSIPYHRSSVPFFRFYCFSRIENVII